VTTALRAVAVQLEQHPPRPQPGGQRRAPMLLAHASTGDLQFMASAPAGNSGMYTGVPSSPGMPPPGSIETVFRLLAPSSRAGNIIGRGGDHIKRIRHETGARLKVYGCDGDGEERLVVIFSSEEAHSQYCAAQDALVRCAMCLTADDAALGQHRVRLLAPQTSIGAVLGKKGSTVMQLRQETGAVIRVHPVEAPLAEAAASAHGGGEPGGDEVVQVDGTMQQCVAALRGVATLLRTWQVRRAAAAAPRHTLTTVTLSPAMIAQPITLAPMTGGGMVAFPVSSSGGHHHALQPQQLTHVQTRYHGGAPSLVGAQLSSPTTSGGPVLWRYRLSNAQAGAVIGKGGHHVTQIRHMTAARVHLPTDQGPDGLRTLEISGAVSSCQAAHTLVNQFLVMGQCSPAVPEHASGAAVMFSPSPAASQPASPHHFHAQQAQQQQQQELAYG
jgi:predicted RNA-binding protein YlqC (UPF0109 family)